MSTATLTQEEVKATHADRPHAKTQLPFRNVVNGRFRFIEWDQITTAPNKEKVRVTFNHPVHDDEYSNQLGRVVLELQERCAEAEATEDGYLAKIDALVTDKVELQAQVKSLLAKVAETQRQLEAAKSKNGRKDS